MSLHGSEDEFETSLSESPRVKSESNPNPFQGAIGSIFPSFTGRVTRSRSSATPPLQNPNYDFPTEVESALQTTAAMLTAASAPPVQNLGRVGESLFSRNILTEETETRVSTGDLTRMIDISISKLHLAPPLVSQPLPTAGNIRAPTVTTPTPSTILLVPQSEYHETTSAQSKTFFSMTKFSNSGKDNRDNMETFQVLLGECHLLTLAKGQRIVPIITTRNPGGYSPRQLFLADSGLYYTIPADDIYKRIHDLERLLVILNQVTAKDLHYLIKRVIADNDAVLWFKTIYDHINGTKNTDIRKATDALHHLKLKPTQTIQENVAAIEEAFRVLTVASGIPITEDQKLYYLQEKLEGDTRMSVLSQMATSKTSSESYDDTIKKLIILDPAPSAAHKMNSLTPSVELCRRHIAGLCTNGSACKYSHGPAPSSKAAPPDKGKKSPPPPLKDTKAGGNKTPYKPPFKKPLVVSEDLRAKLGYPRGVPSQKNPSGYSINQLTTIRTLQSNDVDSWVSNDPQYFHGDGSSNHIDRFNVVKFTQQPNEMIAELPDYYFLDPFPRLRDIRRNIYTVLNSVEKYNRFSGAADTDHDGSEFDPLNGIVVVLQDFSTVSGPDNEPRNIYLFVGFTWLSDVPTIARTVNTREDVRIADKRLMRMMYKIGNRILNADVLIPEREGSENFSYMNFNPTSDIYYNSDEPGFYQSNMRSIEKYFIAIRFIMEWPDIPWRLQRILSLTLIFDFMSYCAQLLRDAIMMQADIKQTRSNVTHTLNTYRANSEYVDQIVFHNAFSAIIHAIRPAPPSQQLYAYQTSPIKNTFSRMTATNREEHLSETTDHTQHNECSDDESDEDPPTPPTVSSAHHRRCQEDLKRFNHPFVMGHHRSLWASIQSDITHPDRKRLSRKRINEDASSATFIYKRGVPSEHQDEETPGTSSSKIGVPSTPMSPLHIEDPLPVTQETSSSSKDDIPGTEETPAPLTLEQPKTYIDEASSLQEIMNPQSVDTSFHDAFQGMRTPPSKSPSEKSVSAIRRAKAQAAVDKKRMNLLTVTNNNKKFMSFKKASHKTIIDSGASTCGTGLRDTLQDIRPTSCSVSAAFGESAQPTEMGLLPPFMLKTVVIEQMNDTTLLSVSQACAQGLVGVFTSKVCKFFKAEDIIPHLQDISKTANPVMSGKVEDGLYLLDSN